MTDRPNILLCCCVRGGRIDTEVARAAAGVDGVTVVPDLCQLAAAKDPSLSAVASGDLIVVACHPRAVKWLFRSAGANLPESARIINAADAPSANDVLAQLPTTEAAPPQDLPEATGDWDAWFPVVDYDLCNNCGQCMNFCLFGVYEHDSDGRITVKHPQKCKLLCPACARVCPQGAIMFPKHADAAIHGGPQPNDQLDVKTMLEGDVYEALRNRSLAPDELQRALAERKVCSSDFDRDCDCSDNSPCDCDCECGDDGCCE